MNRSALLLSKQGQKRLIYAERFRFSSESDVQGIDFSAAHLSEQPKAVLAPGVPALTRLYLEVPALKRLSSVPALTRLYLAATALKRLGLLPAKDDARGLARGRIGTPVRSARASQKFYFALKVYFERRIYC